MHILTSMQCTRLCLCMVVRSDLICLSYALTSPVSTSCSKVTMPLLLLSLSLNRSSSDSTAEEPVDEMEELDSFLRRGPSTISSMSSCCISREEPPPSGVMVTCGTRRPSITASASLSHDPEIQAASRARDDFSAALAGRREPSADALPVAFKSFEARLLHSLGIWRERSAHGERRTVNREISSSHSWVQDQLPGCCCVFFFLFFFELSDVRKPCTLLERGTPLWRWLGSRSDAVYALGARRRTCALLVHKVFIFRVTSLSLPSRNNWTDVGRWSHSEPIWSW